MDRIGSGPDGAGEIKVHPFFDPISWDDIEKMRIKLNFKAKKAVKRQDIPIDAYIEAIGNTEENRALNWSFIRQ
jgi:hypothetical protein